MPARFPTSPRDSAAARRGALLVGLAAGTLALAADVVQQITVQRGPATLSVAPLAGPGQDLLADWMVAEPHAAPRAAWERLNCPGGVFCRAISMASPQVGYVVGELGVILRTTDGGASWPVNISTGFPYYYYGVQALDPNVVIVSGFQNQSGDGIIRWTENGGAAWGPHLALAGTPGASWLAFVKYADPLHGIIQSFGGAIQYTLNGGRSVADWVRVRPTDNWWQGPFTFLPDGRAWLTGYDNFYSADYGVNWTRIADADPLFDGANSILPDGHGFIAGGTISPTVSGWVYATSDGGQTWTPAPVLTAPYPIRALLRLNEKRAWAVGGNYFSNVGGIFATVDGGQNWSLEQDTGAELVDITFARVDDTHLDVYAVGMVSQIWRQRVTLATTRGDLNCDDVVNFFDINPFVPALTGREAYYALYSGCNWRNADCNADGKVDFFDINAFVELLTTG